MRNIPATRYSLLITAVILLTVLLTASAITAALPQEVRDWRFGVIESYESRSGAAALGVGWTRVRFPWAEVQPDGPDTWTPLVSDEQIDTEIDAGREVVGLLVGIAPWAWDEGVPRGLYLPHDDPGNTWAGYVREAVRRYDGRIAHWIIWNEPDIRNQDNPGFTWPGTLDDFYQLQRVAYLAAKSVDPDVVVHLAAFAYFDTPEYVSNFMKLAAADPTAPQNNFYFDALSAHLYFQPDAIFNLIRTFYEVAQQQGIPWKPLWLVETNAPPTDDPAWPVPNWTFRVGLYEQAAFMPQGLAAALAAGAQRIAIYKLIDTPGDVDANPEPFGLMRMDGSRRPAFATYQVAIEYMAGVQSAQRQRWDAVGQIWLRQPDRNTTVLFSRLPAPQVAEVRAVADTAVLVSMWGTRRTITAEDGVFKVELPGALCTQTVGDYCMIGGEPFYLVQVRSSSDDLALLETPVRSVSPTATLTATATSTLSPTPLPTSTLAATNTATVAPINSDVSSATAVPPTEIAVLPPTAVPTLPAQTAAVSSDNAFIWWGLGALLLAGALGLLWQRARE